jgi:hypothetical protein
VHGGLTIIVPRTEPSMALLGTLISTLSRRVECIALPLPREFCIKFVSNVLSSKDLSWVDDELGAGEARLWGPVLGVLKVLVRVRPEFNVECFHSMDYFLRAREAAVEIARLVLRVRVGGRVASEEWLDAFSGVIGVREFPECGNVVIDGYPYEVLIRGSTSVIVLGPIIPTPVDVLGLVALGYLGKSIIDRIVPFVVRYIGDYVVGSRDLTEAYGRLLTDHEYMALVRGLGLPIIL